jgi:hypothetical protein
MENSHSTSYKKDLNKLEFGGNKFMALKLMKGSLQYKNQIIEMIRLNRYIGDLLIYSTLIMSI